MQEDDTMQHTGRRIGGSRPVLGHGTGNTETLVLHPKGLMKAPHASGAAANLTYHSNSSGKLLVSCYLSCDCERDNKPLELSVAEWDPYFT